MVYRINGSNRPSFDDMVLLTTKNPKIDPLLFNLLRNATPYPDEEPVAKIILEWAKKCGVDIDNTEFVWFSEKEKNLIIDLRTDETHTTMFSAHMDTCQGTPGIINLYFTTKDCKDPGEGFIYAGRNQRLYTMYDYENPATEIDFAEALKKEKIYNYELDFDFTKKNKDKILCKVEERSLNGPNKATDLRFWAKHTHNNASPAVLGADDKIGCYIMCKLMEAGVKGLYVFHVGEERGCKGSEYLAKEYKDYFTGTKNEGTLAPVKRCIAFDRAGYKDVISKQRRGNTSSKEFTDELAKALNAHIPQMSWFNGDVQGVYTDSAEYMDIIPECTNLSVGYFNQHTDKEHTDYVWLASIFLPAVLKVEWDKLGTYRDPQARPTYQASTYCGGQYGTNTTFRSQSPFAPSQVTSATSLMMCPKWDPMTGLIEEASVEGMRRIIESYLDIDAKSVFTKVSILFDMAKRMDSLQEDLVSIYSFLVSKGFNKEDIAEWVEQTFGGNNDQFSNDPNGGFEKDEQTTVEEMLGEQYCENCYYVKSQCNCNLANDNRSPQREDFPDEATFQSAIVEYQIRVSSTGATPKTVQELISDEDIRAKLEK